MIILLLIIAALAVWQLLAGLAKLRAAGAAGPDDPRGAALRGPLPVNDFSMKTISSCSPAPRRAVLHPLACAALMALGGSGLVSGASAQTLGDAAPGAAAALPEVTVAASGLQLGASDMTTPATVPVLILVASCPGKRDATWVSGPTPSMTTSNTGAAGASTGASERDASAKRARSSA